MSAASSSEVANGGGIPPEALVFMQNKLEGIYKRTYKTLTPWKTWIEEAENVLVWNRPPASAFLYIAIHWAFM